MSTQWLAIQSFQHSQDLLNAINTLSIHIKLRLAGIADNRRAKAAAKAKQTLISFLKSFESIVRDSEEAKGRPVLGVDPRLRELARSFSAAKNDRQRFRSILFTKTILEVLALLKVVGTKDEKERLPIFGKALVESLSELRALIEEHVHKDTAQILGEI